MSDFVNYADQPSVQADLKYMTRDQRQVMHLILAVSDDKLEEKCLALANPSKAALQRIIWVHEAT